MPDHPKVFRVAKLKTIANANGVKSSLQRSPLTPKDGLERDMPKLRRPVLTKHLAEPGKLAFRKPMLKKSRNVERELPEEEGFVSQRYTILDVINDGGMGTVCRAWDTMLKMHVALKMLKPEIVRDQEAVAQLKAEAAVAMRLSHENIVRIHNIEEENGHIFIVMEYVEGQTLRTILHQMGRLAKSAVLDIAHACKEALAYAHDLGVLHRDIKLDNLMINNEFRLKLLDFGIAVKISRGLNNAVLEGSPGYMSPEQLHGRPLDVRTDVFSFAVVLCELLTGVRAFPDIDDLQHMYDLKPRGIESIAEPVASVLLQGMACDANQRWRTVPEFYSAFEDALRPLIR